MSQIFLFPKRVTGSRRCVDDEGFRPTMWNVGTNNICFATWWWVMDHPATMQSIWQTYTTVGARVGWGLRHLTNGTLGIQYGLGGETSGDLPIKTSVGTLTTRVWNFIVINLVRSANATIWINDMADASPFATLDISDADGVNWNNTSGSYPWRLRAATYARDSRISRVGHIAGSVFSEAERIELYNAGRGLKFAQLSGGLTTKFSGQDYFDCTERSGNMLNQATVARPALSYKGTSANEAVGFWGPPRR